MFKKTVMLDVAALLEDKYGVSPDGGGGVWGGGGGGGIGVVHHVKNHQICQTHVGSFRCRSNITDRTD